MEGLSAAHQDSGADEHRDEDIKGQRLQRVNMAMS